MIKTVWVNGTFDVLTIAHIKLIKYARSLGDNLMIGIDSDTRVKEKKGEQRPIFNQDERAEMLMAIKGVAMVQIFNTDEELTEMIKTYAPEFMVIGTDWRDKRIVGGEYAKQINYFERIENISTTKIIEALRE